MTQTREAVNKFLTDLDHKLVPLAKRDLDALLKLKEADCERHGWKSDSKINMWDFRFYADQYMKQHCSIDSEQVREYFPLDHVTAELLAMYQELLSLHFVEISLRNKQPSIKGSRPQSPCGKKKLTLKRSHFFAKKKHTSMAQRPWSWTRIDGRNVLAVPVRAAVHLYDSDDFILLHAIAARDASPVRLVRFSAFHGKLAALSAARIVVHAPQRRADRAVAYVPLCDFSLAVGSAAIRGLSFSRCADQLLVCGDGIAVLDVHALAHSELHLWTGHASSDVYSDEARLRLWERKQEPADVAKFSPSAAVFASLAVDAPAVKVWRMKRAAAHLPTHGSSIVPAGVQNLQHAGGDPIVYFSWKPAQTPRRAVLETDGCRRPEWFEPARVLLTCSAAARSICIWTEEQPAPGQLPAFVPIVAFSPPHPIDNFRWVMSKSRSPSDERFREMEDGIGDWISGVDRNGVLRLWRVRGLRSYHSSTAASPSVEETPFQLQVDEDAATNLRYGEACVMAYFSPSHLGMPSKFNIVMERADRILLSFDVLVDVTVDVLRERVRGANGASSLPSLRRSLGAQPAARIRKKSWFRTHVGSIAALAAHPSLPLVASVDTPRSGGRTEVLIYWLSFSAFSAETRLIPSGVLPCVDEEGNGVLCVQWIPTLHFDATPMLLVAYASGRVEVYGRSATAAGVVTSPVSDTSYTTESASRSRRPSLTKSPSTAPWTYFDYATGESGAEYEVEVVKRADNDSVVRVEESVDGRKLLIAEPSDRVVEAMTSPTPGDELVAVDGQSVMGYRPDDVQRMLRKLPAGRVISMRLRAHSHGSSPMPELTLASRSQDGLSTEPDASTPGKNWISSVPFMRRYSSKSVEEELDHSVDDHARELQRGFLSSLQASLPSTPSTADPYSPLASTLDPASPRPDQSASIVHAGSISTYGGWTALLSTPVANELALVCVCPAYADDGDYIPDSIILFGLSNLPGSLLAWKGVRSRDGNSFELRPLTVARGFVDAKHNITAISGERDYRQRAFSTANTRSPSSRVDTEAFNSLLFVGDTNGSVEHWRCRVAEDEIHFTLMSAYQAADDSVDRPRPLGDEARVFNRRGYVASATAVLDGPAVLQIEVDDPNRIAVVRADRPHELSILEAESGLGILRLDECLAEGKMRGRILGFCWCAGHVEFNVDALVVNYSSGLVVYHFDTSTRQWTAMGDSIGGQLALFDCTRDASALLIGGGSFTGGAAADEENASVSNEMPLVVGKWDEPGRLLQDAMDWKAPMVPQQLPVWHPFVVLTTLFGMHARVGEKDTALAADRVTYSFSRAFKDAVQMLKLLADVVVDAASTRRSARTGVLSAKKRADAVVVGRYSTAIHKRTDINKAELLFAPSTARRLDPILTEDPVEDLTTLSRQETQILHAALDVLLLGTDHSVKSNALLLFGSFETQHLVLMKAILSFVDAIQSLGFDLDASGADLGAKRFFATHLFTKSLKSALDAYGVHQPTSSDNPAEDGASTTMDEQSREAPASAVLWALHSDAQRFIVDRCCLDPQLTWEHHLGPMWLGLWIKDVKDLRDVVERFAKQAYARSRDAMQVCLYYVALGKSNILGALAKMARDDQNKKLAMFLENDFTQERWSSAAVKNAYSLLSKKRFEASAAFFLLCNPPRVQEAVRVLAVRLGDPSLALVIARLVEYRMSIDFKHDFMVESTQRGVTPAGDVAKRLIREDLIPLFRQRRDQWLESCAFWWLEEFEHACAIVSPTSQEVDVALSDQEGEVTTSPTDSDTLLVKKTQAAVRFYVNLTSIPLFFQHLHSCENTSALQWAKTRSNSRRFRLASVTDIEHAFAFAAYVCKRNGLSDTALVEMLQARHLINTHARLDQAAVESISSDVVADKIPTSPRLKSSPHRRLVVTTNGDLQVDKSALLSPRMGVSMRNMLVDRLSNTSSDDWVTSGGGAGGGWGASPRRMSDIHQAFSPTWRSPTGSPRGRRALHRSRTTSDWSDLVPNSDSSIKMEAAPWLKAQLADLECRRWSSSAFVGKMIGLRVAREMIAHFRADLDALFLHVAAESDIEDPSKNSTTCSSGHRKYLEELCAPLCTQFQVETAYVLEAALAVLQPHAHLHLAEICFLLAQLHRHAALQKWIQYVALCVLRSCATFASCRVTDHVYRDWEGLTVQLCYLVHLDASGELALPPEVVAQVTVAVRTGIVFLGWIRHRADIVRDAISRSFALPTAGASKLSSVAFSTHLALLRNLEKSIDDNASDSDEPNHSSRSSRAPAFDTKVGFTFLGSVAAYLADKDADDPSGAANWREMHTGVSRHQSKVRKMYSLVLLVSILRTLYARATSFLDAVASASSSESRHAHAVNGTIDAKKELDIASSLFTPRKLWKDLGEGPLEGVKRWFALTESHLRFEFDYSVQELQCVCGLYGLDRAAVDLVSRFRRIISPRDEQEPTHTSEEEAENGNDISKNEEALLQQLEIRGLSRELHWSLAQTSDDYILLLLKANVALSVRRFRADPRIYVDCFLLRDAFRWFTVCGIFEDPIADGHAFLARCCKQRKLRLLVAHRGQDSHLFPDSTPRPTSHSPGINGSAHGSASDDASSQTSEHESPLTAAFFHQAMMFVDPWEVEAVDSARRYIHGMAAPRHVELGRDRLSPLCDETCDEILTSVFARDTDLVGMWKEAHGEGWLVTAITQYQLDGVRSVRRRDNTLDGDEEEEEPRVPYLVEIHSRAQRNAMFQETGLPHRFVGIISVNLVEARDLPSCNWIAEGSDPYVFLELLHAHEIPRAEPDGWSVTAYRSRVSPGKSPTWGDEFVFRFAVPTHENHVRPTRRESSRSAAIATDLWAAHTADPEDEAVDALESLLPPLFQGPPVVLHCAVFHKNKVLAHQLLGRTELELGALTSGTPVDRWLPLDGGKSGSLHVRASLSFQLMCSSVAGATELEALR